MDLFAFYEPAQGLDSILDKIDHKLTNGIGQIFWTVLSRWPEPAEYRSNEGLSWRDIYRSLIKGKEFQTHIVKRVLEAYPEKRRFLLVHVPKCAGADLASHLANKGPAIYQDLAKPEWTSPDQLFLVLRNVVRGLADAESIFVHGHHTLPWFVNHRLHRFGDRLFTVLRDPFERVISSANYIVTRISRDRHAAGPDTRHWLSMLGLNAPIDSNLEELALRVLREPGFIPKNGICAQFGGATYGDALRNLKQSEIEIVEIGGYQRWLTETWGITSTTKGNQSAPLLNRETIAERDRTAIESLIGEDRELFSVVQLALRRHPTSLFVRGIDL